MRTAFIEALTQAAKQDPRIWLLTGDLGYGVVEPFETLFGDRFINVGIAEQNMVGVAAGLAMTGKIVFTYSIANFPTLRCLEQLRNDVCYHNLPVIAVAVGGGLAYGSLGYSHHAVEDLAIMRSLPNMHVAAPGDPHETRAAVRALVELGKPGYLRIGKANEPAIHVQEPNVLPNRFLVVREGSDVTLITTGGVLGLGLEAAAELQTRGISAEVLSLPFVAPLDATTVELIAQRTGHLVTIEEHVQGGLGGAIAEHLCNLGSDAKLRTCTLQLAKAPGVAGSQTYLRERMGLTTDNVVSAAIRLVQPSSGAVAA